MLRVGTSGDYAPFSVADGERLDGLDVEIARRFARDAGFRLELVRFRWPALRADLAAGRFDLAMGGVTMRPERVVGGHFTRPVTETGAVVLTRRIVATTAADLDRTGLRLAVNRGGHLERVARRLFPRALLLPTPDNLSLPALLDSGEADAVLTDDAEARAFAADAGPARRIGPFTRDRKAYLGRDPGLVDRLDGWLRAREDDGMLADLRARWLGADGARRRSGFGSDLDALVALVDLRLAFMPLVAAAKERAHRPVVDGAQEARVLAAVRTQAAARGLEPGSAVALFSAQIAAARTVQRTFLAVPPAERPPVEALDLDREARPALAALSAAIVARAAAVAVDRAGLAAVAAEALAERLDPSVAPAADRRAIARAVVALRPASVP